MSGDTISLVYDKTNGKLQFEFITHADGTWTVWQWNTENQGTWVDQVFNGTGANTLFNVTIQNADGSFVYDTFDTAHGDALQQVTTVLADQSWSRWTYDTANAFAWSKEYAQYNTAGLATSDGGTNDDGSSWANWHDVTHGDAIYQADQTAASGADRRTVWDTASKQGWSSYVEDLTAAGQGGDERLGREDVIHVGQQHRITRFWRRRSPHVRDGLLRLDRTRRNRQRAIEWRHADAWGHVHAFQPGRRRGCCRSDCKFHLQGRNDGRGARNRRLVRSRCTDCVRDSWWLGRLEGELADEFPRRCDVGG